MRKIFICFLACLFFAGIVYAKDNFLYLYETEDGGFFGYKDNKGKVVLKPEYTHAYTQKFDKIAFVVKDGKIAAVNRKGETVLEPFVFDNGPDYVQEGLFRFVAKDKMGFADENGKTVIPAEYDFVYPFSGGLARYTLGGHKEYLPPDDAYWVWEGGHETGFINKKGQRFKEAGELRDGKREAVTFQGIKVFLDARGNEIKNKKSSSAGVSFQASQ